MWGKQSTIISNDRKLTKKGNKGHSVRPNTVKCYKNILKKILGSKVLKKGCR